MKRYFLIFLFAVFYSNGIAYDFTEVDNLILKGIVNKYFPGAALLVGNENNVVYEKYYGGLTYDENEEGVTEISMYDLASLTKVIATTSAVMKLFDKGIIDLDANVSEYLPEFAANGKENVTVRNLLLHNSGLKAWMPFNQFCSSRKEVVETIMNTSLEYETGKNYVYSDLNFITLGLVIEKITRTSLSDYCNAEIFEPLNMKNTTFTPSDIKHIPPTEYDGSWRKRLLKGEVHDEAASLMEGISGNAGLFSNPRDIYKLVRTLLNEGKYYNPYTRGLREETLFKPETVNLFTSKYITDVYRNTRALGWDTKQEPIGKYRSACGEVISENCFGHTGYTGTSVWCDKDRKIIIIFLTNRVYPSRGNDGIREIRPDLHNLIIKTLTNK